MFQIFLFFLIFLFFSPRDTLSGGVFMSRSGIGSSTKWRALICLFICCVNFFFLSRSTIFFALFRLKCRCLFWVWSVKCEVARYFSLPTWLPNGYSCLFSDFSKERQINTMWTCANEMNLCKMGWFFLLLLLQLVDTTHTAYRIASSFISYK